MAEAFIGEIRLWAPNFAPSGWQFCHGQTLQINQAQALFSLLSTTYGGDGRTTFALPDLRGRVPVGCGFAPELQKVRNLGEKGGADSVPTVSTKVAAPEITGSDGKALVVTPATVNTPAEAGNSISTMQPWLGLNYIICVDGIYPSRD